MNWPRCSIGVIWGYHALMSSFRHGNVAAPLYQFGSIAMPARLATDCKYSSLGHPGTNRLVMAWRSLAVAKAKFVPRLGCVTRLAASQTINSSCWEHDYCQIDISVRPVHPCSAKAQRAGCNTRMAAFPMDPTQSPHGGMASLPAHRVARSLCFRSGGLGSNTTLLPTAPRDTGALFVLSV